MKKVRKDVIHKLNAGLQEAREEARRHGASTPKSWKYRTRRADHFVYTDGVKNYYNTIEYNGARRHSETEV